MLTVQRLNMDTSWQVTWNDTGLLLDPWLIGSEIDGFSWFNEQWHATPPVAMEKISKYDGIVISQSYSDHLHKETILALKDVPILTTPSARKRISKELPGHECIILPELTSGKWQSFGNTEIAYLDPGRKIDPIYNGIVIKQGDHAIVYFPHGFTLTKNQLDILQTLRIRLLITSFSLFKLPAFLGGAVNPGKENALRLVEALNPEKIVHTHDENKHARGLVKRIAKVVYPDTEELKRTLAGRFVYAQYDPLTLE